MRSKLPLLAALLLCSAQAATRYSVLLPTTAFTGTATIPNAAPFAALGSFYLDMRIHLPVGYTTPASQSLLMAHNNFWITTPAGTRGLTLHSSTDGGAEVDVDFAGRTDFEVRFHRDIAAGYLYAEIWNVDGSNYVLASTAGASGTANYSGALTLGNNGGGYAPPNLNVAFLRLYSGTIATGSTPPAQITAAADLADWEFENSPNDSSAHGLNISWSGAATYNTTPIYAPSCIQTPGYQVVSTGHAFAFDGSHSTPLDGGTTLTYAWSLTTPVGSGVTLTAPTSASTSTSNADLFGSYNATLTLTDGSSQQSSCTSHNGAVSVDANNVVQSVPSNEQFVIGPVMKFGAGPWPWFDATWKTDADLFVPAYVPDPSMTTLQTGHVTMHLIANGTNHITCDDSCNFTDVVVGDIVAVAWNTVEGNGTGWLRCQAATVTSTTIGCAEYYFNEPADGQSGLGWYNVPSSVYWGWGDWGTGASYNWNYYSNVLGLYRLYYATGIDTYLTGARTLADYWWKFAIDNGYGKANPRIAEIFGMVARAQDGKAMRWPGIVAWETNAPDPGMTTTVPRTSTGCDEPREGGYELRFSSAIAALASHSDGTPDTTTRTAWCGYTANAVTNFWASAQASDGSWAWNESCTGGGYYPYGGSNGTEPWLMGITSFSMGYAYQALKDPTGCNNPTAATTALTSMHDSLAYVYNYGRTSGRGSYYDVNWYANGENATSLTPPPDPINGGRATGTVSLSNGGTAVTGVGTHFTTEMSVGQYLNFCMGVYYPCDNTAIMEDYKIASIADDTHLAIDSGRPWPLASFSGSQFKMVPAASTDCAPSLSTYCDGNTDSQSRDLTSPAIGGFGLYYYLTGDSTIKGYGDDWFSAAYGNGQGPGADAYHNNFNYVQIGGPQPSTAKPFGEVTGAGAGPNYLVWRLGSGVTPDCSDLTFTPTSASFSASGGTGSITVTVTDQTCSWTATSTQAWAVTSGGVGAGNGTVAYTVGSNSGSSRTAQITSSGSAATTITQSAPTNCSTLAFSPTSASILAAGGTGSITVTVTDQACAWTASSSQSWLTITAGSSGTGNGSIGYSVAANTATPRSASISSPTGDTPATTFTQAAPDCSTLAFSPTSASLLATSGTGSITVTVTDQACSWTASSSQSWLTVTSGSSGTGNGTISYSYAANPGLGRSASITSSATPMTAFLQAAASPTTRTAGGGGTLGGARVY